MGSTISYFETALAYEDGIRILFSPSDISVGDRGGRGPQSYEELAIQAEKLLPISEALTDITALQFSDADPGMYAKASLRLMAKALTDFEISAYLLQFATEEDQQVEWTKESGTERSLHRVGAIEEYLDLLLGRDDTVYKMADRTARSLQDIPVARIELNNAINDALTLILKRASSAGQTAVAGIMGLGLSEVGKAMGMVCIDLAESFGQAEKVTRLYDLFRAYVAKAYESVVALLGESLARDAAEKFLEWLNDLNSQENAIKVLRNFYDTERTRIELNSVVSESQAELEKFLCAVQSVNSLDENYQKQIKLAERLMECMKYLGSVTASTLPQGKLLTAAIYILLGSYTIFTGADYVDAPRFRLLNRVPGVRKVVEINLSL